MSTQTITNVTFCTGKTQNPVDGSYYFDTTESRIYMAFNGHWSKSETLMTIDEAIRIQKKKERKKKLIQLNDL